MNKPNHGSYPKRHLVSKAPNVCSVPPIAPVLLRTESYAVAVKIYKHSSRIPIYSPEAGAYPLLRSWLSMWESATGT